MQIFLKPKQIGYSWPANGAMNIAFFENGDCELVIHESDVLEVQVDVKQAKNLIQQLTEFCERQGDLPPLIQREWVCRCHCCGAVYDYWTVKADPEKTPPVIEQSGATFTGEKMCGGCGSTMYTIMGVVERVVAQKR